MIKSSLTLFCILSFSNLLYLGQAQSNLQDRLDSLRIGTSNLADVKRLFGEPASQKDGLTYHEGFRGGTLDTLYMERTFNLAWVQQDIKSGQLIVRQTRTIHDLIYPAEGLVITMLDNPWQANTVTITNKSIAVFGLRVGDKLSKVKSVLGKGKWLTTDVEDWWIEYEGRGVRFYFRADPRSPKYPIKLAKDKTVLKIEKYDSRVSFS